METAGSECKTLFLVFSEVLRFSEGLSNSNDPKILFKCAKIVEDMYKKTVSLGALKEFESKLHEFWTLQGLERFPLQYFENAPHLILSRFLCDSKFSDGEVKLAIEEFIVYKSEKEFLQVVNKLSHTDHIVRGLMKSIDINSQHSNFKAVFFVEEFKRLLINTNGSADIVYSAINKTISNDKEGFNLLLKVLCLNDDNELSLHIQELVLLLVCNCLKDHKKTYTYSCILNLIEGDFNGIVVRWDSFTDSLVDLIEFSFKRLKCEYSGNSYTWIKDHSKGGLSFDEIVTLINKLKAVQEKYDYLKELLHKWSSGNFVIIVEDLLRICKIK